jgi:PAS domain S-box-containing protein
MQHPMESQISAPNRQGLLEHVFHASSVGMAIARLADGQILETNEAFCELIGRGRGEVLGSTVSGLGLWSDVGEARAQERLETDGVVDGFDTSVTTPSGVTRILRMWAEVVRTDDEPFVIVRVSDVDGRVAAGARYEELREAEIRYRALVETIPAITYMDVLEGGDSSVWPTAYISPQVESILGFTAAEWIAGPGLWESRLHPDDHDWVVEIDRAVFQEGRPTSLEYRLIARDGRVVWIEDESVLIADENGVPRFEQGVMLDVTARKQAEERGLQAEAKYRTLVEQLPAVVYLGEYGEDGDWLYISPALENVLGYTAQEWLEHPSPLGTLAHPDDLPAVRAAEEESLQTGEPLHAEYRMKSKDGRWVWILDEAAVVRDEQGTPLFMQGVMYDMTERKEVEERLVALDRLKNTLLHTLSHDLKEPLTAILGAASTLERLDHTLEEDERKHLLQTLVGRTKGMNTLLTDLLDLDRLDQGIIEPRRFPVDLGHLTRELVAQTDALRGRTVTFEAPRVLANVDAAKVERMLENLLSNAARHTTSGTRIWVRVESAKDGALLVVEDDGEGIPDDQKRMIFEAFRRGSSTAAGSGIGLSLVARFAELHGGSAWVEDRPGGGSSFRVFLPDLPASP